MDGAFSEKYPDIKLASKSQETPLKSLTNPPQELTRAADISHLERHWKPDGLGSNFVSNEHFKNSAELLDLLEDAARELVPAGEHDRSTTITLAFPDNIGKSAVVEIGLTDKVERQIRDAGQRGETEVNVVKRAEKPGTNLVTFVVQPAFPSKGSHEPVTFRVATAFPGEPAPRMITKARETRYGARPDADKTYLQDKNFWDKHAFVVTN